MSHRVNVLLEDEVWAALSRLPRGERSRAVNEALQRWFDVQRRESAAQRIRARRGRMDTLAGASEDWVRADRDSH